MRVIFTFLVCCSVFSVMLCGVVWCSVLPRIREVHCVAARCSVLHCVAQSIVACCTAHCSLLQCVARSLVSRVALCFCALQGVAVCCSVLQCVAQFVAVGVTSRTDTILDAPHLVDDNYLNYSTHTYTQRHAHTHTNTCAQTHTYQTFE